MKRIATALLAGGSVTALLCAFAFPVTDKVPLISKFDVEVYRFVPVWKATAYPVYPFGLACEILLGLLVAGVVWFVYPQRRAKATPHPRP